MAMVRQGVGNQTPQYIDGCPATGSINIIPDRYYTLVHFSGITKTASVNGAPNQTGLPASPIPVNLGDTIKYTINTANWTAETPRFTLTDKIPKGLTLVTTPGTYTPGMTWGAPDSDGRVTVQWPDQVTSGVFFFTVTVGSLQGDGERIYANMANLLPIDPGSPVVQLELPSGITYHRAEGYVDLIFYKLKNDYSSALQGARFELYKCTNASHIASGNHSAGGCTWDAASRYRAEQQSDAAGKVTFAKVPNDYYGYILVETAAPVGWKTPGAGSYVLISIGTDNAISMSGRGDFASSVILGPGSNPYPGYYKIPNNPTTVSITVKKVIGNYGSQSAAARAELASRVFIIQLGGSAKGEVALKHNETSAPMNVTMTTTTASVTVSETVPMEFSAGFTVSASITHADGTTGTQSGRQITISPGDSVVITVTNTYTPKPFFKGWNYIENLFYGLN